MKLIFITDSQSAHTSRLNKLFSENFLRYRLFFYDFSSGAISNKHESYDLHAFLRLLDSTHIIISGPLDKVSIHIPRGEYKHIGLSCATDLMISAPFDTSLQAQLKDLFFRIDLLVVDTRAASNASISLGTKSCKIMCMPWGASPLSPSNKFSRDSLDFNSHTKYLMFPRSLNMTYCPFDFLNAFKEIKISHPNVKGVFIESGSLIPDIKDYCKNNMLNKSIIWMPPQAEEDFISLMKCMDMIIVCNKTDGSSVTILNAMKQKIPIVTSVTSGSSEWIMDGITGFTYPVHNIELLREAIIKCLNLDTCHIQYMLNNAYNLAKHKADWSVNSLGLIDSITKLQSS